MNTLNTLLESVSETRLGFHSSAEKLSNYLHKELTTKIEELDHMGRYRFVIKDPSIRIYIDYYGTGHVVICCLKRLTQDEKTKFHVSRDFIPPDLEPNEANTFDLTQPGQLKKLVERLHIQLHKATENEAEIEILTYSATQREIVEMDETGILNHMFHKGNEFTMRSVKGKEKSPFQDAYVVYEGPVDTKDITYKNPRQF